MRARLVCTVIALSLLAPSAGAVSSTVWEVSTGERFAAGTLEGTALDGEGRIRLAPGTRTLWGPGDGIVWAVDADGRGGTLVALSNPSRLLRVGDGEPETWFVSNHEGALITALVADGEGGAWFGLAPEGTVMHADGEGGSRSAVAGDSVFVWALARDAAGALWIGTGVPGALLRLAPGGEPERLLETGDDPVRSIAVLPAGGVVVGTGGRGRVIRLGADDRPFVLHDADESEIVGLVARDDGTIYALAASSGVQINPAASGSNRPVDATVRVTASAPPDRRSGPESSATPESRESNRTARPRQRMQVAPGAALYRIDPDGHVVRIWRSAQHAPFSLAPSADGVLVGTGDDGRLIDVDARGRAGRLLQLASDQVSALRRLDDGAVLAGATGDARVVAIDPEPRDEGSYTTVPIDAGRAARWGRVGWHAELPRGAGIVATLRVGNTDDPDETWSDWVELSDGLVPDGLPSTRWLQLRFELSASRRGMSPTLSAVRVHYRPRNRPPAIDSIEIQPPGVVWSRPPTPSNATRGPRVADDPVARRTAEGLGRTGRTPNVRKEYEVGARTISWIADDPDGDRTTFDLDLRREGETSWMPLARGVEDRFHSWDARAVDDGRYRVRVTASDLPDNPDGERLTGFEISELFLVDTAPPSLGPPSIERDGELWVVRFDATDAVGPVATAEISVDAGRWRPLRAEDGVADSARERFVARVPVSDAPAPAGLRVRVADAAGNLAGAVWTLGGDEGGRR